MTPIVYLSGYCHGVGLDRRPRPVGAGAAVPERIIRCGQNGPLRKLCVHCGQSDHRARDCAQRLRRTA